MLDRVINPGNAPDEIIRYTCSCGRVSLTLDEYRHHFLTCPNHHVVNHDGGPREELFKRVKNSEVGA